MENDAYLEYTSKILRNMKIQILLLPLYGQTECRPDFGLRTFLGKDTNYETKLHFYAGFLQKQVLYRIVDEFGCTYYSFLLPGNGQKTIFLAGPVLRFAMSLEYLREKASALGLLPQQYSRFAGYFADIPVVEEDSFLPAILSALGEQLWGATEGFAMEEVRLELSDLGDTIENASIPLSGDALVQRMQVLEERYASENRMMELVARGSGQKVMLMMNRLNEISMEQRTAESVRNRKNYGIILNTLLRKAAEQGGVHPLYIDRISSEFARRIEQCGNRKELQQLLKTMARQYCVLVRQHAITGYSPTVQRIITRIDFDITADQSLSAHARALNTNASYLSDLFRRETGQTLTEFVAGRRMEQACRLLRTTKLPVSEIARQCGITDDNYFSKLFKKHTGQTPTQYRREQL